MNKRIAVITGGNRGLGKSTVLCLAKQNIDCIFTYRRHEKVTVFFDGINLNNATEEGYGRYEEQFLFANQYGPRYSIGARYTF